MQLFRYIRNAGGKATDDLTEFLKTVREPQIRSAINDVLKEVSPIEGATKAGQAGKQAANEIVDNAKWTRSQLSGPEYDTAFSQGTMVDLQPVIDKIDAIGSKFGPNTEQNAFIKTQNIVCREGVPIALVDGPLPRDAAMYQRASDYTYMGFPVGLS